MKKLLAISLSIIMAAVLLAGCGGKGNPTTSSSSPTPTTSSSNPTTSLPGSPTSTTPVVTTSNPPATTPKTTAVSSTPASSTPAAGSSFADLLGKSAGIANFYVEITITSPDGTQTMKQWMKTGNPDKFRMEISSAGQSMIMIYDGNYYYMYDPGSKMAYKMSAATAEQYASASADASGEAQYNPVLIGSETVNGVDCYVYQYTVQGVTTKVWLSKANGLPVRMTSGTTTMDYKNYSFAAIPDSTFELPSDAILITMPGM